MVNFLTLISLWVGILQGGFDWVSFLMVRRMNAQGKTTRMDARVLYQHQDGKMVTHLSEPAEVFILNNREGELEVYNPEKNSVFKTINYDFSSQNNTFYYFLGQSPNMGLESVGYTLSNSSIDQGFLVTKWMPPKHLKADISYVELVSNGDHPVFMGFVDEENAYFKKIYFYDFENLRGITFPMSITEIDYLEEDSVITKTTFTDFQFNNSLDREILDFEVPKNARLVK